jgi:putative ABC transport system ATP-binding protein
VIALIRRPARKRGMSVLMVTHDNRILGLADRVIEMEDGRLTTTALNSAVQPMAGGNPDAGKALAQ